MRVHLPYLYAQVMIGESLCCKLQDLRQHETFASFYSSSSAFVIALHVIVAYFDMLHPQTMIFLTLTQSQAVVARLMDSTSDNVKALRRTVRRKLQARLGNRSNDDSDMEDDDEEFDLDNLGEVDSDDNAMDVDQVVEEAEINEEEEEKQDVEEEVIDYAAACPGWERPRSRLSVVNFAELNYLLKRPLANQNFFGHSSSLSFSTMSPLAQNRVSVLLIYLMIFCLPM